MNRKQMVLFGLTTTFQIVFAIKAMAQTIKTTLGNPNATTTMILNEYEAREVEFNNLTERQKRVANAAPARLARYEKTFNAADAEIARLNKIIEAHNKGDKRLTDKELEDIYAAGKKQNKIAVQYMDSVKHLRKVLENWVVLMVAKEDTLARLRTNYDALLLKLGKELDQLAEEFKKEVLARGHNAAGLYAKFEEESEDIQVLEEYKALLIRYLYQVRQIPK